MYNQRACWHNEPVIEFFFSFPFFQLQRQELYNDCAVVNNCTQAKEKM